ncbi:MAG: MFS transporter [Tissierellia bacterium]|nr:MFS transporter [Tissierellia bacterium]
MNKLLVFITTFIIQFIIAMEMNMLGPLAPFLSQYFNIDDSLVIRFSLGFSAVAILVPFLGVLADRHGKKRLIRFALIIFLLGCIIAAFANSPIAFTFGRIFIGLGYYSLSATLLSYVSEFIDYNNRGKASGLLRIAFGLAAVATPIYASTFISKTNELNSVYLPIAGLGLIALILLIKLPETEINASTKVDKSAFINILKEKKNKMIFASLFFISTSPTLFLNYFSIYLTNEHSLSQSEVGFAYTAIYIGTIIGITFSAIYSDRIGKLKLAKILFAIMAISISSILVFNRLELMIVFASFFAVGLDGGWTTYQAYASEISPNNRAAFMNIFYMVNALTVTFYSIVGSIIYNAGGFRLVILIASIFCAIGLLLVSKLSKIDEVRKNEDHID